MKRDMDLIRAILLGVESDPLLNGEMQPVTSSQLGITDQDEMTFAYNVALLIDANMLTGNTKMARIGQVAISGLTWDGHEFLDSIRDNDVWTKTKAVAGKVGGASVSFLWEIAKAEVKTKLGLP